MCPCRGAPANPPVPGLQATMFCRHGILSFFTPPSCPDFPGNACPLPPGTPGNVPGRSQGRDLSACVPTLPATCVIPDHVGMQHLCNTAECLHNDSGKDAPEDRKIAKCAGTCRRQRKRGSVRQGSAMRTSARFLVREWQECGICRPEVLLSTACPDLSTDCSVRYGECIFS